MAYNPDPRAPMFTSLHYCSRCGMPSTEPKADFDELGVCVACRASEQKMRIDWRAREVRLREILESFRGKSTSGYDCIVPISGGKDSAYQLHLITNVYKLKPLACTFSHNWFSETGSRNLRWCLETFDVDHVMFTPSRGLVNRCAKRSLEMIGDACWHCHSGVGSYPVQVAVQYKIPLIVYGESAAEKSSHADYDNLLEYDEHYFTKISAQFYPEEFAADYLPLRDLSPFKLPPGEDLRRLGFYGIHLGNFIFWDGERQTELLRDHYGWCEDKVEGTYKCYKSVECRMPGVHDFTKFLKRGYGRGTDFTSQDIRAGLMTLEEGNVIARENDPEEPDILEYYLKSTGYSREEFYRIMDEQREKVGALTREEIQDALTDAARRKAERLARQAKNDA
jgi:N-acetyl sugar amidotransferase